VRTPSYAIFLNCSPSIPIHPTRGLRQGDPLSPYPLILVLEGLSSALELQCAKKQFTPMRASRRGPPISHLLYADDCLLFSKADLANCKILHDTIHQFCLQSGQRVNLQKSSLFISPNVPRRFRRLLAHALGLSLAPQHNKYLGLPILSGGVTKETHSAIQSRVESKIQGW
jgi:hypothetical protein